MNALEDLAWWIKQDRKKALRIVELIKQIEREPFTGIGKPESLKHNLKIVGQGESTTNTGLSIRFMTIK